MLEVELDKIHDFQKQKTTELTRRIASAESNVLKLVEEEETYRQNLSRSMGQSSTSEPGQSYSVESGYGATGQTTRAVTDVEDQRREHADADDIVSSDDEDDDDDDDSGKSDGAFEEQFRWLEEEVATLVADVHDLALFSKLNLTGFMKILKKHDVSLILLILLPRFSHLAL